MSYPGYQYATPEYRGDPYAAQRDPYSQYPAPGGQYPPRDPYAGREDHYARDPYASRSQERSAGYSNDSFYATASGNSMESNRSPRDLPVHSRLFVVHGKGMKEEDLRKSFGEIGNVEDIRMVRKREGSDSSGDSRSGVSYIKFSKASEAAKAIDEINGKVIGGSPKPIKVLVAADSSKDEVTEEELLRLFIKAPHEYTESQIRDHFSSFGSIEYFNYVRDKTTSKPKGFAYVKFFRFYEAACALEGCDVVFKPVFAESRGPPPRKDGPPGGSHFGGGGHQPPGNGLMGTEFLPVTTGPTVPLPDSVSNPVFKADATTCLKILCAKEVDERLLTLLCDIIPGFKSADMTSPGVGEVTFNSLAWSQYAQEKLNGFEYPPGSRVVAKFTQTGAAGNGTASPVESNDAPFYPCSITLPPKEPVVPKSANAKGYVARLFIVCSPRALASHVLLDVFCRFGNLIDVYILPGKTFGYAKYNCQDAANKCRATLGGTDVAGCRIKVLLLLLL
jgi:hypothetical protein